MIYFICFIFLWGIKKEDYFICWVVLIYWCVVYLFLCLLFLMVVRYDERSDVWLFGCIVFELVICGFSDVSNWMLKMWLMVLKLMKVY